MDVTILANTVDSTALSLFNGIKYIYMISDEDFYNVSIKDIFRVALSDVTNPRSIENMGLKLIPEKTKEVDSPQFDELLKIIRFAFAVRIPFLKRKFRKGEGPDDRFLKSAYALICEKGVDNPGGIVDGDFRRFAKLAKSKREEPFFEPDWFRKWVYSYGGELSQFNNRNLFLLGCTEALLPMFYEAFTEKAAEILAK